MTISKKHKIRKAAAKTIRKLNAMPVDRFKQLMENQYQAVALGTAIGKLLEGTYVRKDNNG